jgi:predicted ATP-dependent endonuclease of OLD family
MEEPEIAVPPHTQRLIAEYLLNHTTQMFVTSHSPYVIERFTANNTYCLQGVRVRWLCCKNSPNVRQHTSCGVL